MATAREKFGTAPRNLPWITLGLPDDEGGMTNRFLFRRVPGAAQPMTRAFHRSTGRTGPSPIEAVPGRFHGRIPLDRGKIPLALALQTFPSTERSKSQFTTVSRSTGHPDGKELGHVDEIDQFFGQSLIDDRFPG
jgi:hypothetical protein